MTMTSRRAQALLRLAKRIGLIDSQECDRRRFAVERIANEYRGQQRMLYVAYWVQDIVDLI